MCHGMVLHVYAGRARVCALGVAMTSVCRTMAPPRCSYEYILHNDDLAEIYEAWERLPDHSSPLAIVNTLPPPELPGLVQEYPIEFGQKQIWLHVYNRQLCSRPFSPSGINDTQNDDSDWNLTYPDLEPLDSSLWPLYEEYGLHPSLPCQNITNLHVRLLPCLPNAQPAARSGTWAGTRTAALAGAACQETQETLEPWSGGGTGLSQPRSESVPPCAHQTSQHAAQLCERQQLCLPFEACCGPPSELCTSARALQILTCPIVSAKFKQRVRGAVERSLMHSQLDTYNAALVYDAVLLAAALKVEVRSTGSPSVRACRADVAVLMWPP
jgi:hypothetical protein